MSQARNPVPIPRRHKGRAVLDVWKHGQRRQVVLGLWKSKEAESEYRRFLAEFATGIFDKPSGDATVNEVLFAFLEHAEQHYRRADGTPTSEIKSFKDLSKLTREIYGQSPAREFGPLRLGAVRNAMIAKGWCRSRVNQQVGRLKRVFKWATSLEMVPPSVYHGLVTVSGLQRGRTEARETEPIKPVEDAVVDATLPHLNRHVRGMVEVQKATGCRPGEVCQIRKADIDMTGEVWLYTPPYHKLTYRNLSRTIAIGPRAQTILQEFFTDKPDDYLFSPARAVSEIHEARAVKRVTPRYRSHIVRNASKRKDKPKRMPAEMYSTLAYGRSIAKAVEKANGKGANIPRWHPNQLRHTFATQARKLFGLEAAGAALGHSKMSATQIYAERDATLAILVAAKLG